MISDTIFPPTRPAKTMVEQLAELRREIQLRRAKYPEQAASPTHKLTPERAAHQLHCLEATAELLATLMGKQMTLGL